MTTERQITPSPLPAAPESRPAIVELRSGVRLGARVRPVTWLGADALRCLVLSTPMYVVYVPRDALAMVVWCSDAQARAVAGHLGDIASPAFRGGAPSDDAARTAPPPDAVELDPELLIEERDGDAAAGAGRVDGPRVWLAIVRSSAAEHHVAAAEWAAEHGADVVEVRDETVVFQVAAAEEGRVRAGLDARGVELAAVCARCGCTTDRRCERGCAWAGTDRAFCTRCNDTM